MFLLFKPFDLVKGFVIDWMHSVCLGVTKSMIHLWLNAENRGKEFFLGSRVTLNKLLTLYLKFLRKIIISIDISSDFPIKVIIFVNIITAVFKKLT